MHATLQAVHLYRALHIVVGVGQLGEGIHKLIASHQFIQSVIIKSIPINVVEAGSLNTT